ncbi:peptidoglycan glycosyltransferase [Ktedonobacter sp. SOSP1-85]|uniref:peptidoglycan D,D-transpeptidase FtsI family protein n=1 Tax=Ktedonobacter sp. SOSP1-85 TaxID=2778367 RepID=UPI00191561F2|nr:penicillin-binding protein 2 [Ktedonobacter sp. SOSP1-85]GHO75468.1 peptidoglycan glycosyltransferase [Ktedonobacter sp. SOSP1-85]
MSPELQRARSRQMIIFLLICVLMFALLGRLYYWQVMRGPQLAKWANDEHIQNQVVDAPRGVIYDSLGVVLATNVVRDDVYVEPIQFTSDYTDAEKAQVELQNIVTKLHKALPDLTAEQLTKFFSSGRATVRIASLISPEQSQQLRASRIPYTFLEPRTIRVYPSGTLAAQILGYVQPDKGGLYGIEGSYDKLLAGTAGSFTAETDLNGNPLTVGASSTQPVIDGANVTLSIDSTIQYLVQQALEERVQQTEALGGTATVIDVRTGAIVAMVGAPSFDPNVYSKYYDKRGCLDSLSVYFNPVLMCTYEPGSTMKGITLAAALDQGVVTPNTTIDDPGVISFPDAVAVANWEYQAHGTESMTQILDYSANVGAAKVAHDFLTAKRYYPYLERFGFGQRTNVGGIEASGGYRTPTSQGWTPSDLTRQAFGQSITATPLQVVLAYASIANQGTMMRPYLVQQVDNNGKVTKTSPQVLRQVISQKAAQQMIQMLTSAADYNKQVVVPGYSVAAKSGTATTQGVSDDLTEASIAGFLPASNPRYAILVTLDHPRSTIYGGTAAAPLWNKIAEQVMWHYHVPSDRPVK